MTESLICIELPGQISIALKERSRHGQGDPLLLALTPHVEYSLQQADESYVRPEDYHSESDIDQVGLADLANLGEFCRAMDRSLQNRWPLLKDKNLAPTQMHWYYLKILFNSISIKAFITRRILETTNPEEVLYFSTRREPVSDHLFFVRESAWSRVIPQVCETLGIPCRAIGTGTDPSVLNIRCGHRRKSAFHQMVSSWRHFGASHGGRTVANTVFGLKSKLSLPLERKINDSTKRTVMALGDGYSLGLLLRRIEEQDEFNLLFWDVRRSKPPIFKSRSQGDKIARWPRSRPSSRELRLTARQLWAEVSNDPQVVQHLKFSGVDCRSVASERLHHFVTTVVPEIVHLHLLGHSLVKQVRPVAVLDAIPAEGRIRGIVQGAQAEGVPLVIYRHGDTGGHIWMNGQNSGIIENIELQIASHVLTFGDGDVQFLEKHRRPETRLVPIGSAVLDVVKRGPVRENRGSLFGSFGLDPAKYTVMYVPTTMDGNIRAAPFRGRSPSRMFHLERSIVEALSEYPQNNLVVKLQYSSHHPTSPIASWVRDKKLDNVRILDEPFQSLIGMADLFITDYPSTSFLEMLTTDKPILVCGHDLPKKFDPDRWHPSMLEMWSERVEYSDDLNEFLNLLRSYLRDGRFHPVQSNNMMLKLFGTHLDDGRSIERAYEFLVDLAEEHKVELGERVAQNG